MAVCAETISEELAEAERCDAEYFEPQFLEAATRLHNIKILGLVSLRG